MTSTDVSAVAVATRPKSLVDKYRALTGSSAKPTTAATTGGMAYQTELRANAPKPIPRPERPLADDGVIADSWWHSRANLAVGRNGRLAHGKHPGNRGIFHRGFGQPRVGRPWSVQVL